jgi:protein ImuA
MPVGASDALPSGVWRGDELGAAESPCVGSGWDALDAALPGGGWPTAALTEVLSPSLPRWNGASWGPP